MSRLTPKAFDRFIWRRGTAHHRSLHAAVLWLSLPLLGLVLGMLGLLITQLATRNIEREEGNKLAAEAKFFAEFTDLTIGRQLIDLQSRAALAATLNLVEQPKKFFQWIDKVQESIPEYTWIGFADRQGVIQVSTSKHQIGQHVADRHWYQSAKSQPTTIDVNDITPTSGLTSKRVGDPWRFIDVAAPVRTAQGQYLGVLGAHLSWDWLVGQHRRFSESLLRERHAEIIVADSQGVVRLVAPGVQKGSLRDLESFQRAQRRESGWVKERWPDEREYLVGYTFNPGYGEYHQLGWVTLIRLPVESLTTLISPAIAGVWLLIGGAVALFAAGIVVLGRFALVPLQNLVHDIERAAQSDGQVNLTKPMPKEFLLLGHAINQLIEKVRQRQSASQAKSLFLADMSHEIRTPLNAIAGRAELLRNRLHQAEEIQEVTALIHDMHDLTLTLNQILDLSKIEEGALELRPHRFNWDAFVAQHIGRFQAAADHKNLQLNIYRQHEPGMILVGDAHRIGQILDNLLSNAIKFTDRGSVAVGFQLQPISGDQAWLMMHVSDSGVGLSAAEGQQLFERFQQVGVDSPGHDPDMVTGSGLGLSVSRALARKMSGDIQLTSSPGVGTTFSVRLLINLAKDSQPNDETPAAETATATPAVTPVRTPIQAPEPRPLAGHVRRALVVDDHEANREVLTRWLALNGFETDTAASGQAAIAKARHQPFDVILMDIGLPDMSGHAAAHAIRQELGPNTNCKIIAVTGYGFARDIQASSEFGLDAHVTKPIDFQALKRLL